MRKVLKQTGFTLVELLVVMGIIGILMALLFPAIGAARKAALKSQAQTEVRSIATAIEAYFNEYGKLPIPDAYQGKDSGGISQRGTYFSYNLSTTDRGFGSRQIIMILTANDTIKNGTTLSSTLDDGEYKKIMNPRKIVFLEAQSADNTTNAVNGYFLDPWGNQYHIALDSDYNGKMEFFSGGAAINETVTKNAIVYSFGPSGVEPTGILPSANFPDFISSSFD